MTTKSSAKKRKSNGLSMRRVLAQLKGLTRVGEESDEEPQAIRVVLNDLTPAGIHIFSREALPAGFEILISLTEPKRIDLHGKVMSCQQYNLDSKVIDSTGQPFRYRARVEFQFANASEKDIVQEFCTELVDRYIHGRQRSLAPAAPQAPSAPPAQIAQPEAALTTDVTSDDGTPQAA